MAAPPQELGLIAACPPALAASLSGGAVPASENPRMGPTILVLFLSKALSGSFNFKIISH